MSNKIAPLFPSVQPINDSHSSGSQAGAHKNTLSIEFVGWPPHRERRLHISYREHLDLTIEAYSVLNLLVESGDGSSPVSEELRSGAGLSVWKYKMAIRELKEKNFLKTKCLGRKRGSTYSYSVRISYPLENVEGVLLKHLGVDGLTRKGIEWFEAPMFLPHLSNRLSKYLPEARKYRNTIEFRGTFPQNWHIYLTNFWVHQGILSVTDWLAWKTLNFAFLHDLVPEEQMVFSMYGVRTRRTFERLKKVGLLQIEKVRTAQHHYILNSGIDLFPDHCEYCRIFGKN